MNIHNKVESICFISSDGTRKTVGNESASSKVFNIEVEESETPICIFGAFDCIVNDQ
jgi:hypothetical protein